MDKYKYIQTQLQRRVGERQLCKVAEQSGVSRRTLNYVLSGKSLTSASMDVLSDYLRKTARKKIL